MADRKLKIISKTPRTHGKKCCICGKPVFSNHSKYCRICSQFIRRMIVDQYPPSTIKNVLDFVRQKGYVCYYTGMPLDMDDSKSPWYGVLDHWIPNNDKKLVLTSALINDMKTDLTEKEFWYFIEQLYNYKKKGLR